MASIMFQLWKSLFKSYFLITAKYFLVQNVIRFPCFLNSLIFDLPRKCYDQSHYQKWEFIASNHRWHYLFNFAYLSVDINLKTTFNLKNILSCIYSYHLKAGKNSISECHLQLEA